MGELRTIKALMPRPVPHTEVVVSVSPEVMENGGPEFYEECINPVDYDGLADEEDLILMSAAFVTLAKSIPAAPALLLRWLVDKKVIDTSDIECFAEERLGMDRADTPISEARRQRRKAS